MSDAAEAPRTRVVKAQEVRTGMRVMKRRRVCVVVGAVATSSANYSINVRPEDDPTAELDLWVGPRDTEWTLVES